MNILVIVAHSDDEIFGCGGTIAKHIAAGDQVSILTMTDGVSSRENRDKDMNAKQREDVFISSCNALGVKNFSSCDFPDNEMDKVSLLTVVKQIETQIDKLKPELIYTHFHNDLNIDHRLVHNAVMTACRPQPKFCVKEIRSFEVVSSSHWNSGSGFNPTIFVDITESKAKKDECLALYKEELRPWPHQRSLEAIDALEKFRGASIGSQRAEAFVLVRKIEG